jgi:ABC-type molybdate transport system permease subunit
MKALEWLGVILFGLGMLAACCVADHARQQGTTVSLVALVGALTPFAIGSVLLVWFGRRKAVRPRGKPEREP